ncbi:MAG: XrtA system polysaccharide deacetylase [Pirellulales bacterium]
MQHAFTVDVEDYFQVSAFDNIVARRDWDQYPVRVVDSTRRLLDLLARHSVQGTFYILGWIAERYPSLVKEIDSAGHEIGSHSYWHRLIYEQEPGEFRSDLRRSIHVLEAITGKPVTNYRAPSFSVTRSSQWALEIMVEEGIRIDSSVFPVLHDRYGIPDAPATIHCRQTPAGPLWEFPPSVLNVGRWHLPVAGGGYFRLYPAWLFRNFAHRVERSGRPYMFYIHPWEVDPQQPRLTGISATTRFRHYNNLRRTLGRLDALLSRFSFTTVARVVESMRASAEAPQTAAAV